MILSFPVLSHSITLTSLESCCLVDWVAEKICDVWLPVVPNLPQIPIPLMNTFFPFFPAFVRPISALLRLISPLMGLISALMRFISALMILISALMILISALAYNTTFGA